MPSVFLFLKYGCLLMLLYRVQELVSLSVSTRFKVLWYSVVCADDKMKVRILFWFSERRRKGCESCYKAQQKVRLTRGEVFCAVLLL